MRQTMNIALKEFKSQFTSPIAYIVIAGFIGIMGWMFFFNLSYFNMQNLQYQQFNMGKGVSITDGIIKPLYGNMNVILLFLVPFITMRLIAEERKQQTIQLLLTSPITLAELVIGKYLSAMMLISVMFVIASVYPIVLFITGNPDIGPVVTSILGTFLVSSCYVAVGTMFSSMTENQIVAGALTFATLLFFWLISWAQQSAGPVVGEILEYLSLIQHFNNFSQGLLNAADVFFYLSFAGVFLFITHRILDSYRWR